MASGKLIFKDAEKARDEITALQKKEISQLYNNWADEIGERAKYYAKKTTASSVVSERQMKELQKMLRTTSQEISNEVYSKVRKNIYTIADAVVSDNVKWLESFGFSKDGLNAAFNYVPDNIVRNLVTGQIYDSGWSLSKRIWGDNEQTLKDIYQVVAQGLAQNQPIYEIAKNLEAYVRPGAKLPWNLTAPDGVRIYKKQVDYNAQRLARTLVQHGYQQSFIAVTEKNPFIMEYIWISNGSRVCPLCQNRNGIHYKKGDLPMDHPNGMCIMEPVVADNMVDQLADWFNSPDGTFPDIDDFASNFGYNVQNVKSVTDYINKYGTSTKNPTYWYNTLTKVQKAEAKILKDASGLSWPEWYKKYIYTGDGSNLGGSGKVKAAKVVFNAEEWLDSLSKNDLREFTNWCLDWLDGLTKEEVRAIKVYTGSAYSDMNKFLRGITDSTRYEKEIKAAKDALRKAKLPEDTIVRRGADKNSLRGLLGTDDLDKVVSDKKKYVGTVVQDKGFMSTSPDPNGGFSDSIEYVIKVPKGTDAMYVAPISQFESENELLLNAGTKFIVEDIEVKNGRIRKVFLNVIK